MLTRITILKLLILLLLGYPVAGISAVPPDGKTHQTESLYTSRQHLHQDLLQPQVIHINVATDHLVKLSNPGFALLFFQNHGFLPFLSLEPAKTILQDTDHCENVSKLLFPYHFFW